MDIGVFDNNKARHYRWVLRPTVAWRPEPLWTYPEPRPQHSLNSGTKIGHTPTAATDREVYGPARPESFSRTNILDSHSSIVRARLLERSTKCRMTSMQGYGDPAQDVDCSELMTLSGAPSREHGKILPLGEAGPEVPVAKTSVERALANRSRIAEDSASKG
jgi:hypothetical protein